MAIDPTNHAVLYTIAEGGIIFKSTNRGTSWTILGSGSWDTGTKLGWDSGAMLVTPSNNQVLICASYWHGGIYKSVDGGVSWALKYANNSHQSGICLGPENQVFVATDTTVLQSTDWGETWQEMGLSRARAGGSGAWASLGVSPESPPRLWYFNSDYNGAALARSITTHPGAAMLRPVGFEQWTAGNLEEVGWTAQGPVPVTSVDLLRIKQGDAGWTTLASGLTASGTMLVRAPTVTGTYMMKAVAHNGLGQTGEGASDWFTVKPDNVPVAVCQIDPTKSATRSSGVLLTATLTQALTGIQSAQVVITPSTGLTGLLAMETEASLMATLTLYDDGTHGDLVAGDGIYSCLWDASGSSFSLYTLDVRAANGNSYTLTATGVAAVSLYSFPSLGSPTLSPISPSDAAPTRVSFTVTDANGVMLAAVLFSSDGGTSWKTESATLLSGSTYSATLPLAPAGALQYKLHGANGKGFAVTGPPYSVTVLDRTPPAASFLIEEGSRATGYRSVAISPTSSEGGQMLFANSPDFSGASWQALSPIFSWNLSDQDGACTVYAKFRDAALNTTDTVVQTILLDRGAPFDPNLLLNAVTSSVMTNNPTVSVLLSATDSIAGVSWVSLSNNGASWGEWAPLPDSWLDWGLSAGEGLHTIYARFADTAGNVSTVTTATIFLDTLAPTALTLLINGGDSQTSSRVATLTLGAVDHGSGLSRIYLTNSPTDQGSWIPWTDTSTWDLGEGEGTKTVYASFQDQAGNCSETTSGSIELLPSGRLAIDFSLQGATTSYTATFAVSFYQPGGASPLFSRTVTVPALAGSFTLTGVAAGSYDIKIKEGRALSALRTGVAIGTGTTTVDFGEQRVGDANGDDVVNILDFALLKASFGKSTGQPGFDPRADFNGDGTVNAVDFVLMKSNFGRWGAL